MAAPLLKQTSGRVSPASLPFGERILFIYLFILFLRGQFAPSDVPDFVCSPFPLVLHLLGTPEFAALLLLQLGLNTRKTHSPIHCPA